MGPNTEKTIPINPKTKPCKFLQNRNESDFLVGLISEEEVLEVINNSEKKSVGPNILPINLLKMIPGLIIRPLCEIISLYFATGRFPDALKNIKGNTYT